MTLTSRPTALITGASSGIGAMYARRLADRGYDLILIARRLGRLQQLADELSSLHGITATAIQADLTTETGLKTVEHSLRSDSNISLLINNAGAVTLGETVEVSEEEFTKLIALNVTALTRLCRAALGEFVQRNQGTIVNIASVMSLEAMPITSIYSGTKAYVVVFSRGLQQEVANTGVKVQVVLPAGVATEIYDGTIMPLDQIPPELVMSAENMVDAALAGLDADERVTLPSVDDISLWETYDSARLTLFNATQTGKPARRYSLLGVN